MRPLAVDLFCGLGGWTEGLLAAGYEVIGFDIERHVYGDERYPAQLVLQDVLTLHGSQFRDAALIVASPPCQAYSYRAMPWKRAKELPPPDNSLFDACFRIQREACEAAGRYVPLVVENVCGAQRWVGRAAWHYGSFYLWGDVPAIMPFAAGRKSRHVPLTETPRGTGKTSWFFGNSKHEGRYYGMDGTKVSGLDWKPPGHPKHQTGAAFNTVAEARIKGGTKSADASYGTRDWFGDCGGTNVFKIDGGYGIKNGNDWFGSGADASLQRRYASRSNARKAASAMIAKIPFALSYHVAQVYAPYTVHQH